MLGNRVLLKWKEPRFFLNQLEKQNSRKIQTISFAKVVGKFALGGLIIAVIIGTISYIRSGYQSELLIFAFVFVGLGIFLGIMAGLATFLDLKVSPEISLREKDIMFASVRGVDVIPYKEIQSCNVGKTKLEDQEVYVLEIKLRNGNETFLEIDPAVENERVVETIKSRNVQMKHSLYNPIL